MAVNILSHLIAGGPVMIPIGILSVLGLMSALERAWNLPKCRKQGRERLKAFVLESVNRDDRMVFLEEKGRQLVGSEMKKTFLLGVTATVAPMLGLMGTVLGMIITFQDIQAAGVGDPAALAGGISQALITTLAGLCVGIPALIAHRWVLREIDDMALDWEGCCRELLDGVQK